MLHLSRGAREILCGVDIRVSRGEMVALMGLSGSGKTTILRAVAGLDRFNAGEIHVDDIAIAAGTDPRRTRRALHQRVGMVFQFHYLFEHLSALENVVLAPMHVQGKTRTEAQVRAHVLLEQLGVGHRASALPRELSGGEAQRVAIARALAVDPPLLLMDEPTASLVREFATRVIVLAGGCVVEEGAPISVLSKPQHPATRELLQVERARKAL
jgi:ABC-type polar amino acid transport system ATPase subunit